MGVSLLTALEIFTNPYDLHIQIGEDKESGKYAICISRGPGHKFKPILTSTPFAETFEDEVKTVGETLEAIRQAAEREFMNTDSFVCRMFNSEGKDIDLSKVLNVGLIAKITGELQNDRVAKTYKI